MLRSSCLMRCAPVYVMHSDVVLRDTLFRELRPHQARLDVPVLASMASELQTPGQRMVAGGATDLSTAARRSLYFQCPHSLRMVAAEIDGKRTRVMVASDPEIVVGVPRQGAMSSSAADIKKNRIWKILFEDADNSAVTTRELRRVIVREVVVPTLHGIVQGRSGSSDSAAAMRRSGAASAPPLAVSVAELQRQTGWHRFAHILVDFTSLQDALVESGHAALVAAGRVTPTDAALWAAVLQRERAKRVSDAESALPSVLPLRDLFNGTGASSSSRSRYNPSFLPPSLAQIFHPRAAFREQLRKIGGFDLNPDLTAVVVLAV